MANSVAAKRGARAAAIAAQNKDRVAKLAAVDGEVADKMQAAIAKATSPDRPKRAAKSKEYGKARELAKAGKRGAGKQMTDAQLDAYIVKANAKRPAAMSNEQLEIAYWVDGLALSRTRWVAAWARVEGAAK